MDDGHILALTIVKKKKTHFSARVALLLAQVKDPAHVLTPMCRRTKVASRFNRSPKDDRGIIQKITTMSSCFDSSSVAILSFILLL